VPLDAVLDTALDGRPKQLKLGPPESMLAVTGKQSIDQENPQSEVQMRANNEQLTVVQDKVSRGEYEVNSQRVAGAILERIGVMQLGIRNREAGRGLLPEMNVPRGA